MIATIENVVAKVGRQLEVVYLAFTSNKVSIFTKVLVSLFFFYAASPIDIIPDSVPFFGVLDDLIIIPIAYGLSKLTIKKDIWNELKVEAEEKTITISNKYKIIGACLVGTLTIALLALILMIIIK